MDEQRKRPSKAGASGSAAGRTGRTGSGGAQRTRKSGTGRTRTVKTDRGTEPEKKKVPAAYRKRTYTAKVRHTGVAVKLLTMAAVVVAVLFGFVLFFRVGKVADPSAPEGSRKWLPKVQIQYLDTGSEEQTVNYYAPEEVVAASGIEIGANLLTVSKDAVAARIMAELPYVSEVQIRRDLPDGVTIYIAEFEVTYSIQDSAGSWWLVNRAGRVLNAADTSEAESHTRILGLTIEPPKIGEELKPANTVFVSQSLPSTEAPTTAPADTSEAPESSETVPETTPSEPAETEIVAETLPEDQLSELQTKKTSLLLILSLLEKTDYFKQIVSIDLTYSYDIVLWYGEQYQIRIGNTEQLEYKLAYLSEVLKELKSYQTGTIDLTFTEEKNARFQPFR